MQKITWSKEDLQSSVDKKLAMLRANRLADKGLSLEQRLALADDRIAFEQKRVDADVRRSQQVAGGHAVPLMKTRTTYFPSHVRDGLFMGRVDDMSINAGGVPHDDHEPACVDQGRGQHKSSTDSFAEPSHGAGAGGKNDSKNNRADKTVKERPDLSHAVDSHAVSIVLKPRPDPTFVPHARRYKQAMGALQVPERNSGANHAAGVPVVNAVDVDDNLTEVPADRVRFRPASLYGVDDQTTSLQNLQRRRLVEQTLRQSSEQWVVLDRAKVLDCLAAHPAGLTMVAMAFQILGPAATPRDTRRLSALIKREEARKTVVSGGRGKPIVLTQEGRRAIEATDVDMANQAAVRRRQKRIEAQHQRLLGEAEKLKYQTGKRVEKAREKAEKLALSAYVDQTIDSNPLTG